MSGIVFAIDTGLPWETRCGEEILHFVQDDKEVVRDDRSSLVILSVAKNLSSSASPECLFHTLNPWTNGISYCTFQSDAGLSWETRCGEEILHFVQDDRGVARDDGSSLVILSVAKNLSSSGSPERPFQTMSPWVSAIPYRTFQIDAGLSWETRCGEEILHFVQDDRGVVQDDKEVVRDDRGFVQDDRRVVRGDKEVVRGGKRVVRDDGGRMCGGGAQEHPSPFELQQNSGAGSAHQRNRLWVA